jgi:hypothetical protein
MTIPRERGRGRAYPVTAAGSVIGAAVVVRPRRQLV